LHQINFISTNIITRISTQTIMIYESNEMSLPRPLYLMSLHLRDLDSSLWVHIHLAWIAALNSGGIFDKSWDPDVSVELIESQQEDEGLVGGMVSFVLAKLPEISKSHLRWNCHL
jgi:hypothetical protein